MKDLISYIIKNITGTEDFTLSETEDNGRLNYKIKIDKDLAGLIIGKEGHTIKAIRNLMKARAVLENKVVNISVEGDEKEKKE